MQLIQLVKTDLMKQNRGLLWLIILVIPFGTTAAMFLDMYIRYEDYLFGVAQKRGITSWQMLLAENHSMLQWGLFLSFFVAVISAVVHQVEFEHNSWTHLLSMPVKKAYVFIAKFITIVFSSAIMIILNTLGLIAVGKIIGFPEPLDIGLYSNYVLYRLIGILGVAAIHNWLSSYFKNLVIPVVIGFIGMVCSAIILFQSLNIAKFFPYLYPFFAGGLKNFSPSVSIYGGIISCIIFLLIGIVEFTRRDIL